MAEENQIARKPVSRSNSAEDNAASSATPTSAVPEPNRAAPPVPTTSEPSGLPPSRTGSVPEGHIVTDGQQPGSNISGSKPGDPVRAVQATPHLPSNSTSDPRPVTATNDGYGYDSGLEDDDDYELEAQQPPPYSEHLGAIEGHNEDINTQAVIADDGRVNIRINQLSRKLSVIMTPALRVQEQVATEEPLPPPYVPPSLGGEPGQVPPPPMNIVIHVVGSRGDVQPFVALGKVLRETYNHRVRLATHPVFKKFVEENGLEFFSIGGDPAELMAFMVKNPGLMPGFDTMWRGDIGRRRREIATMIKGCWRSCIETGDGFGVEADDSTTEDWMSSNRSSASSELAARPFVADAIIANPPSFAHIHCAEKLGIPLHMMFTMPWSPTQQFPHPLANIQSTNADISLTNFMSYTMVEMLTWQGLGDVINRFRRTSLQLEPISVISAPGMLARERVPWTYCWSPALIPKPKDWANFISISGFYFLNLASNYTPEPDLAAFLADGPPPVYIGFGSIVVDDPNGLTNLIFEAVKKTGRRALVSKGWGGFGAEDLDVPPGVFMLGNCPHDWLFKQVSCVVHHGGAGTTAAGIACGRPTVVVPFFGDQPFWGSMIARAGAGPEPIPHKKLTAENLSAAILEALKPTSLDRAAELAEKISHERGCDVGAQSFHQNLKIDDLRCVLAPSRIGVWRVKRTTVRLSAMAVTALVEAGELQMTDLKLHRPREYDPDGGPTDPISGASGALVGTMSTMMLGVADFPVETLKVLKIHPDTRKQKGKKPAGSSEDPMRGGSTSSQTISSDSLRDQRLQSPESTPAFSVTDHSSDSLYLVQSPTETTAGTEISGSSHRSSPASSRPQLQSQGSATTPSRTQSSRFLDHTRSDSGSNGRSSSSCKRAVSPGFSMESALGTGKGVSRIVGAGLKSPLDFTYALTKGFHNASRLYGEEPRQIEKVTDLGSGLKVGAKEFGMGMFEGITGLVRDPIRGAKKEGAAGFIKGFGKGIAGITLKPSAAVFALPAYTFKGVYQEISKGFGRSVQNYILAARVAQGYEDYVNASEQEKNDILHRWRVLKPTLKKKKNPGQDQIEALNTLLEKHKEKRKGRAKLKGKNNQNEISSENREHNYPSYRDTQGSAYNRSMSTLTASSASIHTGSSSAELPGRPTSPYELPGGSSAEVVGRPLGHVQGTIPRTAPVADDDEDEEAYQRAINLSLHDTRMESSQNTEEEDELIERAIQASIDELQRNPPRAPLENGDEEDEEASLQRALTASMAEAGKSGASEEEQRILEEVLRKSVLETRRQRRQRSSDSEWDSSSDDEYGRSSAKLTLTVSPKVGPEVHVRELPSHSVSTPPESVALSPHDHDADEEEQLKKAMELSMQEEDVKQKEKSEEEIVMEYVKKMSLMEEEHRRRMLQGRGEDPRLDEGSSSASGSRP